MKRWIEFQNERHAWPQGFGKIALEAFEEPGSDILRADARSLKNGFRVRIQVENGFLRLLGRIITMRTDGRQDL
jgi:hypothetical protein